MTEIERLARVAYDVGESHSNSTHGEWDAIPEGAREFCRCMVRSVLQAMREPSNRAQIAVWAGADCSAPEAWHGMLDHILAGGE